MDVAQTHVTDGVLDERSDPDVSLDTNGVFELPIDLSRSLQSDPQDTSRLGIARTLGFRLAGRPGVTVELRDERFPRTDKQIV